MCIGFIFVIMYRKKIKWMCYALKYGLWKIGQPKAEAVNALVGNGYAPLTAMVLASRGVESSQQANAYLSCDCAMPDPFSMRDMDRAAGRLALALDRGEKIAVFGDYDVDGITATCLLTDFIRSLGGDCIPYIPGRLEEGYGLNPIAIEYLHKEGVKLIVTVDCGITAVQEAQLCKDLGISLVITDHHECKPQLPEAAAVVDPHRSDCTYPHKDLSGVGVAFKLAAALCGSQQELLDRYADMVCLGTVADVMPLSGENRVFVSRGLAMLENTARPGIAALLELSGCKKGGLTASSVGYTVAPRINAAGRMGKIDLALQLFLTEDPAVGHQMAQALCDLNRDRQDVESEIHRQVMEMLPEGELPDAIVLADESWHQGVVGIVASRICEEYCRPTFLICLDGDHGKASSRSYGGFNLFSSLTKLSPLLESYGGHELAAGFTIHKDKIADFRREICALAKEYYTSDLPRTVLETDCAVPPEMLTLSGLDSLNQLEPCGNGCPKPVLVVKNVTLERIAPVGNGRHLRLKLRAGSHSLQGIWFHAASELPFIAQDELVDVAFQPQINDFRGECSVQLNVQDIRPACKAECSMDTAAYSALRAGTISSAAAAQLLPERNTLALVWRFLAEIPQGQLLETSAGLCRKLVRRTGQSISLGQLLTCLDIFCDVGLLEVTRCQKHMSVRLLPKAEKADLQQSRTMQLLIAAKESN